MYGLRFTGYGLGLGHTSQNIAALSRWGGGNMGEGSRAPPTSCRRAAPRALSGGGACLSVLGRVVCERECASLVRVLRVRVRACLVCACVRACVCVRVLCVRACVLCVCARARARAGRRELPCVRVSNRLGWWRSQHWTSVLLTHPPVEERPCWILRTTRDDQCGLVRLN